MYILDTDMLTHFQWRQPKVVHQVLQNQSQVFITVISFQEQLLGWNDELSTAASDVDKLAIVYDRMAKATKFLVDIPILPFTKPAILRWQSMKKQHRNFAKYDLRIGAIAIEFGAIVVTANLTDFRKIMPLNKIVDWTN